MGSFREFREERGGVPVRGYLHDPAAGANGSEAPRLGADGLVLTHGAGANCRSALLVAVADAFSEQGLAVLRCDLPFRQARPYGPPQRGSAERDREGLRAAVEAMRQVVSGRVYLCGHSYGGRQASMLAAEDPGVAEGLLLLSYPLHPPQRTEEMRTAHFPRLQTPALFVQGTRDGFGSIVEMEAALKLIPASTELVTVEGAGHELMTKRNVEVVMRTVVEAFGQFTGHEAAKAG